MNCGTVLQFYQNVTDRYWLSPILTYNM